MKTLHIIAFSLLIIGGLNWLIVGLANRDIGTVVFGGMEAAVSRLIYLLIGLSAIFEIVTHRGRCRSCEKGGGMSMSGS